MQLSGKVCIAYLSGPRHVQDEQGQFTGQPSDVSAVRLLAAVKAAQRRNCPIYAPIKEGEVDALFHDLATIRREIAFPEERVIVETGAEHTLANAWYALRYAYAQGIDTLVPVTSCWHKDRVSLVFGQLALKTGVLLGRTVALEYEVAACSSLPHVQEFEKNVMTRAEEWKCEADRGRVAEYIKKMETATLVNGFVVHPDRLAPFRRVDGRTYQSVAEPGRRVS